MTTNRLAEGSLSPLFERGEVGLEKDRVPETLCQAMEIYAGLSLASTQADEVV